MKVLMYGWEFPPKISGGLGTACYAIVNELSKQHVDLSLVLPYTLSEVTIPRVNLINCDTVALEDNFKELEDFFALLKSSGINNYLSPYSNSKNYNNLPLSYNQQDFLSILVDLCLPEDFKKEIKITGKYGDNLLIEVFRYALLASTIATKVAHDVIYAHDWLTMLAGVEAKRFSHKPLILHIHALETDRSGLWVDQRIFAIEKYGMEQADAIVAVSQYTKDNIVKYYGINPEKITVIHNGIYCHDNNENNTIKKDNDSRPKMVLFLGRITHQKGPYFFIEIAQKILAKRKDVQFVIAGTGDLMLDMINRVAGLRIGQNIHFTGFLEGNLVNEIYKLADVYVMPSVSEPFGLSALEALTYDIPAVITKQSGVSEVLKHTLTSDFWDTDDMAAKILALLEYPALRNTSLANERKILDKITWAKTAEKLINLYNKII